MLPSNELYEKYPHLHPDYCPAQAILDAINEHGASELCEVHGVTWENGALHDCHDAAEELWHDIDEPHMAALRAVVTSEDDLRKQMWAAIAWLPDHCYCCARWNDD